MSTTHNSPSDNKSIKELTTHINELYEIIAIYRQTLINIHNNAYRDASLIRKIILNNNTECTKLLLKQKHNSILQSNDS